MRITHKNIQTLFAILIPMLFTACESMIQIDLPEDSKKLVVEAQLTTSEEYWTVKLTRTQSFNDQTGPTSVNNALVIISDDMGNADTLKHDVDGTYKSDDLKQCIPGHEYILTVYDGDAIFTAHDYCRFQNPIDTFLSFYNPIDNLFRAEGWYVFEITDEWEEPGDYYLWKIYRNDTLLTENGYLTDEDEFQEQGYFNEGLDPNDPFSVSEGGRMPISFPYSFTPGDKVRVEQCNINKGFHHYLNEVQKQRNRGGTPFDAPPTNPNSNLSSGAIGYFSVVNVVSAQTVIPD